MIQELALFHPAGRFGLPGNPFGKDVANEGLFKAFAKYSNYRQLNILNQLGVSPRDIAEDLFPGGVIRMPIGSAPLHSAEVPARGGILLRGQPYLSELSWVRRAAAAERDYSLVGLIHTIAPPGVREMIGAASVAPTEPWDALVCTSPSVQRAMNDMFEAHEMYLSERFGAASFVRPQLPLVPLGVDCDRLRELAADRARGAAFRSQHGVAKDDLVVLWVGRLSFYEKAFPQPMLAAVEQAAQQAGVVAHFFMVGWFPGGSIDFERYKQAAKVYAPSVNVVFLDGNDSSLVDACWPASDVFISLVDNIQETFGLAPVEAMAAGLPVVVSDWDGYAYTVRHGKDGFLVPTLAAAAPRLGASLSSMHSLQMQSYQDYVGAVAQHTAVSIGSAAADLAKLFASAELRSRMGASGQSRVFAEFSWPVVVRQYDSLFEELSERRYEAKRKHRVLSGQALNPLRGNPFQDFQGFSTDVLGFGTRFSLIPGMTPALALQAIEAVELNRVYPDLRATLAEVDVLLRILGEQPGLSLDGCHQAFDESRAEYISLAIVWLAKIGILEWS